MCKIDQMVSHMYLRVLGQSVKTVLRHFLGQAIKFEVQILNNYFIEFIEVQILNNYFIEFFFLKLGLESCLDCKSSLNIFYLEILVINF